MDKDGIGIWNRTNWSMAGEDVMQAIWDRVGEHVMRGVVGRLRHYRLPLDGREMDIYHDVFTTVFDRDAKSLSFDPKKIPPKLSLEEGLKRFLGGVAKHKVDDHFRAIAKFRSLDGGKEGSDDRRPFDVQDLVSEIRSAEDDLIARDLLRDMLWKLSALVTDDPIAIGVIKAALEISEAGNVDQQLAELVLGDPAATQEIVNAKKRIRRAVEREEKKNGGRSVPWMRMMTKTATETHVRTTRPTL